MATDTLSKPQPAAYTFDFNPLEDASADLEVAGALIDCSETMLGEIKSLITALGHDPKAYREIFNLDVLLCEALAKTRQAKEKINKAVDDYVADRRAGESA